MQVDWQIKRWAAHFGPWLIFLASVAFAAWLYFDGYQRSTIMGYAEGEEVSLAPLQLGRLVSVAVETGQEVVAGQVVAALDPSTMDMEIAILEAEQAELGAQIDAEKALANRDRLIDTRRLDTDVERLKLTLSREEAAFQQAKAELQPLQAEHQRLSKLVADRLATADDLSQVEVRYVALDKVVQEKPQIIELLRAQVAQAEGRRQQRTVGVEMAAVTSQPFILEREVLQKRLEQLRQQRLNLTLRAPTSGIVTTTYKRPGETVEAGESVVSILSFHAARITAYVPEEDVFSVKVGDRARMWPRGVRKGKALTGRAIAVSPQVSEMPIRFRAAVARPTFGQKVVVLLDNPEQIASGQTFNVEFEGHHGQSSVTDTAVADNGQLDATRPRQMEIPEAISLRSRFEPSAIIWQPELLRYLLVSDDTGQKNSQDHIPWLFKMTVDGQVEPEPVLINGVTKINDLEAIARGSDGAIYVLSSQSFSKHGKRPRSRTAFLKLVQKGQVYSKIGEVHLAELLDAAGPEYWVALGIPAGTKGLNIEGLTFYQGEMFIGLKAPLTASGAALIWRLKNPDALFSDGTLDHAGLSLWATVKLASKEQPTLVAGGISELLFLADGSLLITSTPTRHLDGQGDGGLWRVATPKPGVLVAKLERIFPGLKPEGISPSPKPGHFVLVFDAGAEIPYWVELPWPL